MKIRMIITSVGGLVAPNIIKSLKQDDIDDFYIVGVDMYKDAVGFYFTDAEYVVPPGNSEEYSKELFKIAKKEKIDIILPLSDEEVIALSKCKKKFRKEGILIPCSEYKIVKISSNKSLTLKYLEEKGIDIPKYRVPHNINELKNDIFALGYPKEPVVFKPNCARGARGFWVINSNFSKENMILYNRVRQTISLEWLLESLKNINKFPEILVMEYLPGKDFNVDVLAWHGDSIYIIPNERLVPNAGPVQVGLIKKDKKVQKIVKKIVKTFEFDYWINVEVAYSKEPNSRPLVYEINPRISAPILANKAAGIDLLKIGIKLALGKKINRRLSFKETKMVRYWNEIFI